MKNKKNSEHYVKKGKTGFFYKKRVLQLFWEYIFYFN